MNQVFQWMNDDENIKKAAEQFHQPGRHSIYGLGGSAKSAFTGNALADIKGPALLVVPGKEQAAAWQTDLQFWLPDMAVLDFPFVDKAVFTTTAKSIERSAQ